MFSPPHEVYRADDLQAAFGLVVAELQGPPEVVQRLQAGRDELLQLLGNTREAGQWVARALSGLDWDWPRWHSCVRDSFLDLTTPPALKAQAAQMSAGEALGMLTVKQLKELLREHGAVSPAKAKKPDVLDAVLNLPSHALQREADVQIARWLEAELLACHREMGTAISGRICHIAHERLRLRQRSEPGFLALRPHWEFVCEEPSFGFEKSRACQKLHGKVLPAAEAMKVFPLLPCDRLGCGCRIETRR